MHSDINLIVPLVWQEVETSETESEGESETEGSSFDSSDETTMPVQSGPPQFVQKLIVFAAGLKLLLSAIMNTAGKVVVTLLLGMAGTRPADVNMHCSIKMFISFVYFTISLSLCVYVCMYRHYTPLPHLRCVFRSVSWAGLVVGVQPLHQHANLQLPVCDDGHLQWRTPAGSVPLPVPPLPAACTTRRCLRQVQKC